MENPIDAWKDATLKYAELSLDVMTFRLNAAKIFEDRETINSIMKVTGKHLGYRQTLERHNSDKALVMSQGIVIREALRDYRESVPEEFVNGLSEELSNLEEECSNVLNTL
jgi:hypothetical protein